VLKRLVTSRLRGHEPASLLRQPYAQLPPCLPPSSYAEHAP